MNWLFDREDRKIEINRRRFCFLAGVGVAGLWVPKPEVIYVPEYLGMVNGNPVFGRRQLTEEELEFIESRPVPYRKIYETSLAISLAAREWMRMIENK